MKEELHAKIFVIDGEWTKKRGGGIMTVHI
jgi:hypothetical protein